MKTLKRIIETEVIDEPIPEEPEDVPPSDKPTSNTSMNFGGPFIGGFIDVDYQPRCPFTSYRAGEIAMVDGQAHKCLTDGMSGSTIERHPNANALVDGNVIWIPLNQFSKRAMEEMLNYVFRPFIGEQCVPGQQFLIYGRPIGHVGYDGTLHVSPDKIPLIQQIYQTLTQRERQPAGVCGYYPGSLLGR